MSELEEILLDAAQNRTGAVPEEKVVERVLAATEGGDYPVRAAALSAVLRRVGFAKRDGLRVAARPRGAVLGEYATRRKGRGGERPYRTALTGVDPLAGSCDCPDFARNGLGVCKHLLVVAGEVYGKPRRLARAQAEQAPLAARPRLRWDPVWPLLGPADPLRQVEWTGRDLLPRLERWIARDGGGLARVRESYATAPGERLRLVTDLRRVAGGSDPALDAILQHEQERLRGRRADLGLPDKLQPSLRSFRRRLYGFQREGVARFLATGRLLLADDMGLGKTMQAMACAHVLWHARRMRSALIIVPASLKAQWRREWEQATDVPVRVVEGSPDERRSAYEAHKRGVLIVNYEQVLRDLEAMRAVEPELVVLDEAQRIKNWQTKTAMAVKSLDSRYRLVLTGTPMENRVDELASIMDWVDDRALEPKWRLAPLHLRLEGDGSPGGAQGVRHMNTLRARLAPHLLRRTRDQVLDQLPERTDVPITVEMTPAQQDEHDALDQPIAKLARVRHRRPLTPAEFLRLMSLLTTQRVISNGLAQLDFTSVWPDLEGIRHPDRHLDGLSSPKLSAFRELATSIAIDQGRKMVVFSQWRRMLRLASWAISDVLADAGLRCAFFTGAESQAMRQRNVVEFHDDPSVRVLFLSDAGGVGLNLQRAASCCVNLELPWNPAVLEQRIARIHRIGQTEPIDVYHLTTATGIEARIGTLMSHKRAFFVGLFDGDSDEIRFDESSSFCAQIDKLIGADVHENEEDEDPDGDALPGAAGEAVARADESGDAPPAQPAPPAPPAPDVPRLFEGIEIKRRADGGMTIEADEAAAGTLAAMFDGMAKLLRGAAGGAG